MYLSFRIYRVFVELIYFTLFSYCRIKTEEFQDWATEIVNLFKYEKISTYFVPSNAKLKRFAHGKLWDKYNNVKKLIIKHKKACKEDNVEITPENNNDCEEALIALRAIQPEDINIEKLWKETFTRRNRGTSIRNYFEEYPILKTAIGATLLQIDFQLETKTDTLTFQQKWPDIAPYIRLLAEKTEVCPTLCEVTNDVPVETLSLLMLPYLLKPSNVKTGNKKRWKPSKIETAESFIFRVSNIADLEPKLHKRKEKLEAYGLTLQPMVVAVGSILNLTSFYVIINDIKYTSTSLMNAIDLCFKIFFALDATYPADSEIVWYFLQQYIYGITNKKYHRNFISVETTWHDVEQLMLTRK
ncbi:uncharacterized protein LOC120357365 [Solenopsis invicta]|uniref:uncharacterized protein LOC120357365 n=1 Tax=Solenopsis invicta TaxID=13686 RepID=UPI00193DBFD1|nr:uncharacterized protein LOC120357365 [Solenopsis invicta]